MHPLFTKQLNPLRIIQECHATLAVFVFLGNELRGGFHLFEQRAHDAVGPDAEIGAQRLKMQLALKEPGVE